MNLQFNHTIKISRAILLIAFLFLFSACSKVELENVITQEEINELLLLSDTGTLKQESEVLFRLNRITEIFQRRNDNRGLFPLVYAQTTKQALLSLQNEPEVYTDLQKAKDITIAFAKRYLFGLHDHLTGAEPEYHWKNYYALCNTNLPRMRITSAGLNAHLTVDLARAVYDVNGNAAFEDDYLKFGEALVKAAPYIIEELKKQYNTESAYLLNGLFLGDILDPIFGEDFTTQLAFQFIRTEAFQNAQYLLSPAAYNDAQKALYRNWEFREELLDILVQTGLIK
jgi:hypothetical protein